MNMSSSNPSVVLRHDPYGEQHPYIPLPYERFPHRPIAGEAVTLGVETGNHPPASAVWCTWEVDGKAGVNQAEAQTCKPGEDADQWQIKLPAFQPYDVVHYRLYARNAEQQVESEEFTFSVLAWVDAVSILAFEKTEKQAMAILQTTREGFFIQLQAGLSVNEGTLAIQLSSVKDGGKYPARNSQPLMADWEDIHLTLQEHPLRLELLRKRDHLLLRSSGSLRALVDEEGTVLQYRMGFESPSDEAFYGFGERFNALDQRGNCLDNRVYGQYTNQEKRTYIPVPFFISSRGYGLWLQTERQAEFDMAASKPDQWTFSGCPEEDSRLGIQCFFQPDLHAILKAFTDLTGKPKLPPDWVFGLWMSSNDWNSQAEVLRQLHKTQELDIPASVLVIEAWSDEINFYIWNGAQYQLKDSSQGYSLRDFVFPENGLWPNLKAMVAEIHQAGLRLVLWQNPTIKQADPREQLDDTLNLADQAYAIKKGFVVTSANGNPHRVEAHMPWFQRSLVLDFTNPEASEWWCKKREYLVTELGVDGFKTDGGEHIWDIDARFFNGMRGSRGINHYPVAYESAYRRFMQGFRGDDFVLFSRAGYTGAQQNPCHWAGDENSTWEAFRATIRALLNVGICGLPFVGWDIAGFAGPLPGSELYLRAAAFSVFCPIMQYHSDVNHQRQPSRDRTPWNIQEQTGDPQVVPVFRAFANLRMNLIPYILAQAYECSQSGLPLMRALALEYPYDPVCREYTYEYFFGEALLVAPVVEEGISSWPVYLPEGDWRELWSGELYHGPAEMSMDVPRDRIPVFQKKGSLLVLNLDESGKLCSPVGNSTGEIKRLSLRIFPGGKFEATIVQPAIAEHRKVVVEDLQTDGHLSIQIPELPDDVNLIIFGDKPSSVTLDHESLPQFETEEFPESAAGWRMNAENSEIWIHLPEVKQATIIFIS